MFDQLLARIHFLEVVPAHVRCRLSGYFIERRAKTRRARAQRARTAFRIEAKSATTKFVVANARMVKAKANVVVESAFSFFSTAVGFEGAEARRFRRASCSRDVAERVKTLREAGHD